MFYKFNNMLGRMVVSSQEESYIPQGFSTSPQPSQVFFDTVKTKTVYESPVTPEHAVSSANSHGQPVTDASHGGIPASPGYQRIQKLKNMFLKDGLVVWQKIGTRDRSGFLTAVGFAMFGSAAFLHQFYRLANRKKNY